MTNPIEWKAVPGYEGWYEASRCGKVRVLKWWHPKHGTIKDKVHELEPLWYRKGYYKVQFNSCGKTREPSRQYIHRVVYRTFHGEIPDGLTVNHKDGIHDNNHADNLELLTHQEQHTHARGLGIVCHRTKSGLKAARLTIPDVLEIRRLLAETTDPHDRLHKSLAARYGVSDSTIRFIDIRHTWRHV